MLLDWHSSAQQSIALSYSLIMMLGHVLVSRFIDVDKPPASMDAAFSTDVSCYISEYSPRNGSHQLFSSHRSPILKGEPLQRGRPIPMTSANNPLTDDRH
jgi:hypothetical protein